MSLRKNWDSGNTTLGVWLSNPSSVSAEAVVRTTRVIGPQTFRYAET